MRFYLDKQMPLEATPAFLRHHGHSSRHAVKLGYAARDDDFHFQYARSTRCIFITRDEDFVNPHRYPCRKHPGVIILAVGRSADAAETISVLNNVLHLFRTAASLYESKIIAHATYCTRFTEQGQEDISCGCAGHLLAPQRRVRGGPDALQHPPPDRALHPVRPGASLMDAALLDATFDPSEEFRAGIARAAHHWLAFFQDRPPDLPTWKHLGGHALRALLWCADSGRHAELAADLVLALERHALSLGHWHEWEPLERHVIAQVAEQVDAERLWNLKAHLAFVYTRLHRLEEAIALMQRNYEIAVAWQDVARQQGALMGLAESYLNACAFELGPALCGRGNDSGRRHGKSGQRSGCAD